MVALPLRWRKPLQNWQLGRLRQPVRRQRVLLAPGLQMTQQFDQQPLAGRAIFRYLLQPSAPWFQSALQDPLLASLTRYFPLWIYPAPPGSRPARIPAPYRRHRWHHYLDLNQRHPMRAQPVSLAHSPLQTQCGLCLPDEMHLTGHLNRSRRSPAQIG